MPNPSIGTTEVASRLGTTPQHVRKLAREGRLPYWKVGALLKFDTDEIEAWLAARRIADAAPPLSDEQRDRLRVLMREGAVDG